MVKRTQVSLGQKSAHHHHSHHHHIIMTIIFSREKTKEMGRGRSETAFSLLFAFQCPLQLFLKARSAKMKEACRKNFNTTLKVKHRQSTIISLLICSARPFENAPCCFCGQHEGWQSYFCFALHFHPIVAGC